MRPFPSTSALWEQVCTLVHDQVGALGNSSPDDNTGQVWDTQYLQKQH